MDTVQIGGVDTTRCANHCSAGGQARLIIHERTHSDEGSQRAQTEFTVVWTAKTAASILSPLRGPGPLSQQYHSRIRGNARCSGIRNATRSLVGQGTVNAAPELLPAA